MSIAIGDLDDSGAPDLAMGDVNDFIVTVLLNQFDFCPADLDDSDVVGPYDLAIVLGNWGPVPPNDPIADISNDSVVGSADLAIVLGNWGPCS